MKTLAELKRKSIFTLKDACTGHEITSIDFKSYNSKHKTIEVIVPEYGTFPVRLKIANIKTMYVPMNV